VHARPDPQTHQGALRAKQAIDYGRRARGYIFGAFQPATGEVLTIPYDRRTTANWIDFLNQVETWVPARWEFVFQPTYAAYLNLIEPWWQTLRSLVLKGRRFKTWEQVCEAIDKATVYWNTHVILSFGDEGGVIFVPSRQTDQCELAILDGDAASI
jgi:hypothetical protein